MSDRQKPESGKQDSRTSEVLWVSLKTESAESVAERITGDKPESGRL